MDFLAETSSLEVTMNKLTQAKGTCLIYISIMITVTHFQYFFDRVIFAFGMRRHSSLLLFWHYRSTV